MDRRNRVLLGVGLLVMIAAVMAGCTQPPQNVEQGNNTGAGGDGLGDPPGSGDGAGADGNTTANGNNTGVGGAGHMEGGHEMDKRGPMGGAY